MKAMRMPDVSRLVNEHVLLATMLTFLHATIWAGPESPEARAMMLAHLGAFLLWQPIWQRSLKLGTGQLITYAVFVLGVVFWLNWLTIFMWLILLAGIVGGQVSSSRRQGYAYRLALITIILELLTGVISQMFTVPLPSQSVSLLQYGLLLPAVILVFVPVSAVAPQRSVDFLHGLVIALFTAIIAMGSLLMWYATQVDFATAVLQTVFGLALFLLLIGWLLSPQPGFSGLDQLWTRYVLNASIPFESWLVSLAELAEQHDTAEGFLAAAMHDYSRLNWVRGVAWQGGDSTTRLGNTNGVATPIQFSDLSFSVYTAHTPGATLLLHAKLLLQVITLFYTVKQAQQALASQARVQAVYETGARITHDIKNLLQSLHTLSNAVKISADSQASQLDGLLARQLPLLTQRLQLALDKLSDPTPGDATPVTFARWWSEACERHAHEAIDFQAAADIDTTLNMELFDAVLENLLENARVKRQSEATITITARAGIDDGALVLSVTDSGSAIPADIANTLFKAPVPSANGLGIGLYQAASLAHACGYQLLLFSNETGAVCFRLRPQASASVSEQTA